MYGKAKRFRHAVKAMKVERIVEIHRLKDEAELEKAMAQVMKAEHEMSQAERTRLLSEANNHRQANESVKTDHANGMRRLKDKAELGSVYVDDASKHELSPSSAQLQHEVGEVASEIVQRRSRDASWFQGQMLVLEALEMINRIRKKYLDNFINAHSSNVSMALSYKVLK
ncbi:uncharacterized protein KY384_008172 [Bacidia gigantensis]|uniref:uncharacterized protein n=1 Tax=Bacidia gigantensis TaxID=2732470 RepID=UPI001D051AAC|nr:uncharacterized protein KY384_008172 [Bacidia gigantensis]KAG8526743.1 hypothetical protein KY384_008172 [Bacidia gigantensis]